MAVVVDCFSRRVVGWSLQDHLCASLVLEALELAVTRRRPTRRLVHHSDRGSQYVSLAFGQRCRQAGIELSMGPTLFGQTYGTAESNRRNAIGRCVSQHARAEHENRVSARDECAAEQKDPNFAASHDGKSFREFYGNFGRCVSSKARAARAEARSDTLNAARHCKAERARLGVTEFRRTYGRGPSDRNAFGKCVSALAKAQND